MMRMNPRELVLLLATLAVALFGVSYLAMRPKAREWKAIRETKAELRRQVARDRELIASREQWAGELETLSGLLTEVPAGQKVDVFWLTMMDGKAEQHGIKVLRRSAGEEKRMGDVYEMPIECQDWEGDLKSLVHFLFDLQSAGAMLDIRQLQVRPKSGAELKGRFSLSCAYTRGSAKER